MSEKALDEKQLGEYEELPTTAYLRDLAARLWLVASVHTGQYDCERLCRIAKQLEDDALDGRNENPD